MPQKLDKATRTKAMASLNGWAKTRGRDAIHKTFVFTDFNSFSLFLGEAESCEKMSFETLFFVTAK